MLFCHVYKGKQLCDVLFLSWSTKPVQNGVNFHGKEFTHRGANSFLDPHLKGNVKIAELFQ